jgi:hypothetical protein
VEKLVEHFSCPPTTWQRLVEGSRIVRSALNYLTLYFGAAASPVVQTGPAPTPVVGTISIPPAVLSYSVSSRVKERAVTPLACFASRNAAHLQSDLHPV